MTEAETLPSSPAILPPDSEPAAPPSPRKTWTTPTVFVSALSGTKNGIDAYEDGGAYTNYDS